MNVFKSSGPAETRKSLWANILDRVSSMGLLLIRNSDQRRPVDNVTFSISFIALAAKLAKADGQVTRDEVSMFRRIFHIPHEEHKNAARVYDLCRQDPQGFETYARKMNRVIGTGLEADILRRDVLDGLFHIAMADEEYHENEHAFLCEVADIFEIPETEFNRMMARHVPQYEDPYVVLGVTENCSITEIRSAWRQLVKENHPDKLIAQGLPKEMIKLANARISDLNKAYETLRASLEVPTPAPAM
ncbi:TerB family tellurite resistance protein [Pseudosulfitobacter pseudonitzschiae]|uniref:molecular chaperone DjiA n=1 Tax=Pseudosulfitobacter pseudonitzschiae TaxID=1402135 RepID=UPI003B7A5801